MRGTRLLVASLLLVALASGKKQRQANRQVNNRKRDCETQTCAAVHVDDKDNCVLRCQSEACYEQVYGGNELEPGEIDSKRSREFNACTGAEARKRPGKGQPPLPAAEPAGDDEGGEDAAKEEPSEAGDETGGGASGAEGAGDVGDESTADGQTGQIEL